MRIDINKYIAKYDFDVAKKICPMVSGTNYREELQNTFKMTATQPADAARISLMVGAIRKCICKHFRGLRYQRCAAAL